MGLCFVPKCVLIVYIRNGDSPYTSAHGVGDAARVQAGRSTENKRSC